MNTKFLLNRLYIVAAVLREILVVADTADITLPARKHLPYGLRTHQLLGSREVLLDLAVDLIANADRDLVQVAQSINNGENHLRCALDAAAVAACYAVEPADATGPSGRCAVLALIAAALAQLFCFLVKDLADECACAYCAGVCLYYYSDILNLIRGDTCANCAVGRQCRGEVTVG